MPLPEVSPGGGGEKQAPHCSFRSWLVTFLPHLTSSAQVSLSCALEALELFWESLVRSGVGVREYKLLGWVRNELWEEFLFRPHSDLPGSYLAGGRGRIMPLLLGLYQASPPLGLGKPRSSRVLLVGSRLGRRE